MRQCDIDAVNIAKPDYIGFVFADSRLKINAAQAGELKKELSPDILAVGVFANEPIENIISLCSHDIINITQLHGDEPEEYVKRLKTLTKKPVIKAVPVTQVGDVQKFTNTCADYILLDNKGGATGKPFDWNLIGELDRKFFLAGGLDVKNIEFAIEKVNPYVADISTGVETDGVKDKEKIIEFVNKVRNFDCESRDERVRNG
jgi:phosphoribosylanthranilate isomerase